MSMKLNGAAVTEASEAERSPERGYITKEQDQAKRQIHYLEKLLSAGRETVNPNPILGTAR